MNDFFAAIEAHPWTAAIVGLGLIWLIETLGEALGKARGGRR